MWSGTSSWGSSTSPSGNSGKRSIVCAMGLKANVATEHFRARYLRLMATAAPEERGPRGEAGEAATPAGPAHVAVVSFLAARAAPTGGFWIALAGGVALARVAVRRGARLGFGASIAAMLETVAIIGPARFGIPLTQAATAPLLGRLEARGWRPLPQIVVCAAIRILHNAATTAFFIWVITGGLDAYAGTYDAIGRRIGIEVGTADALALTAIGLLAWGAFASTIQVLVYRRGLRRWDRDEDASYVDHNNRRQRSEHAPEAPAEHRGRFDPRAITLAAVVLFGLLLASTEWLLLGAVALVLALAWAASRPDPEPLPTGLLFAAILALGAFIFTLGGGLGLDAALAARPARGPDRPGGHLAARRRRRGRPARGLPARAREAARDPLAAGGRGRAGRHRRRGQAGGGRALTRRAAGRRAAAPDPLLRRRSGLGRHRGEGIRARAPGTAAQAGATPARSRARPAGGAPGRGAAVAYA